MFLKDRIPTYPNRKKIVFEDDKSVRYATIEYADVPLEEGTPMNAISLDNIVPNGAILMWSGREDNIPDGWALCDGKNGTPDLRGRFIMGANYSYPAGSVGGNTTIDWTHTHDFSGSVYDPVGTDRVFLGDSGYATVTSTRHTHNYEGVTKVSGKKNESILPPYYALCFIMKITQIAPRIAEE